MESEVLGSHSEMTLPTKTAGLANEEEGCGTEVKRAFPITGSWPQPL